MYLFTGTPGSGKTLHTAELIYNALKYRKVPVIANFEINPSTKGIERFTHKSNKEITPSYLYDFSKQYWNGRHVKEDEIMLVIDEAQLVFNSRSWQQGQRMDWIEFFSQHRHFGYKIILICQYDRMIDRQIRSLVEIEINHRRLDNYGIKGKLLALPFRGKLIAAIKYYYGLKEKVGQEWILPKKKYLKLYNSYNRFEQA